MGKDSIIDLTEEEKMEIAMRQVRDKKVPYKRKKKRAMSPKQKMAIEHRRSIVYELGIRGMTNRQIKTELAKQGIDVKTTTLNSDRHAIREWYANHPENYEIVRRELMDSLRQTKKLMYDTYESAEPGSKEQVMALKGMADIDLGVVKIITPTLSLQAHTTLKDVISNQPTPDIPDPNTIEATYEVNKDDESEEESPEVGAPRSEGDEVESVQDGGVRAPSSTDSVSS